MFVVPIHIGYFIHLSYNMKKIHHRPIWEYLCLFRLYILHFSARTFFEFPLPFSHFDSYDRRQSVQHVQFTFGSGKRQSAINVPNRPPFPFDTSKSQTFGGIFPVTLVS